MKNLLLPAVLLVLWAPLYAQPLQLVSGKARLTATKETDGFGILFSFGNSLYPTLDEQAPVVLEVDSVRLTGRYTRMKKTGNILTGEAELTTRNGTLFQVSDTFSVDTRNGSFTMGRGVRIGHPNEADKFFNSYFGLRYKQKNRLDDLEFFAPGIWYKDNKSLRPNSMAGDYSDRYFYFREDRLPLPLVMWRSREDGQMLTLSHAYAYPETFFEEKGLPRIVDERMQVASLGFMQEDRTAMVFCFPGNEGEKTYVGRTQGKAWAFRSHPVKKGVRHQYRLAISFSTAPDFAGAVQLAWKTVYDSYHPLVVSQDIHQVYYEEIRLLDHYWRNIGGAPGWPFSVYLPDGNARAYDYQMGFIGFQTANAYYLIRHGLETQDRALLKKGTSTIDFWAKEAQLENGLPKSWVNPYIDKPFEWRKYQSYMRIAGDGMEAVLQAWSALKKRGINKPDWLSFCDHFGQWLVKNQNEDGSYYLRYDWWDGSRPSNDSKYTTTNVIRFLVELYYVTDNRQYLDAALKAGGFSYGFIQHDYLYVGGVIDNPNVKDRESGQQALYAFLALYDITGQQKWLDAALQAAAYSETFMYAYNIPMATGDTLTDFPRHRNTLGQTLIATGQSGVDNGMSFSSFQYYRLYLLTGNTHLLDASRQMMYNSLQTMDMDGKMGYRYKALQTEAFSLAGNTRGNSVRQWLAWNTAAVMDPLCRFSDAFRETDLSILNKLPLKTRKKMSQDYGKTFGLMKAR